jgi:hypothetical protein
VIGKELLETIPYGFRKEAQYFISSGSDDWRNKKYPLKVRPNDTVVIFRRLTHFTMKQVEDWLHTRTDLRDFVEVFNPEGVIVEEEVLLASFTPDGGKQFG